MFWRKKKEVEKVGRVLLPPPSFFEHKSKAKYRAMCRIMLDAEKYDLNDQIEVRNALLIELKNQIDRVMESQPIKTPLIQERRVVYEKIEAMNEIQRSLAPREEVFIWLEYRNEYVDSMNDINPSTLPKYDNPPPPPPPKDKK